MKPLRLALGLVFLGLEYAGAAGINAAPASLELSSPADYQIFQRATQNQGTIIVAGKILSGAKTAGPVDGLEIRLLGKSMGESVPAAWRSLAFDPSQSSFHAQTAIPAGGWYCVEVRALRQGVPVAANRVEHVGVGEIFVIAGQSNSANYGEKKSRTQTGMVATFDGTTWQLAADPEPGAGGKKGSFMPLFGDALVDRFRVPVGIVAMGIGSTSVREWLPSGILFSEPPTIQRNVVMIGAGQWESSGKIFDRFIERMKALGPHGFRAVLWHQGESDAHQADPQCTLPGQFYREYLETIISDSRKKIGWDAPWFVAQASYHNPGDPGSPDIRAAQKAVCQDGCAFLGPNTDTLTGRMREKTGKGIHLSAAGLNAHAQLWVGIVAPWLEATLRQSDRK